MPGTNGSIPNEGEGTPTTLTQEQALALLQQPQGQQALPTPSNENIIFGNLIHETKSWSDIQTIKLDKSSQAQIVVTFLSPQLIQAIYYSEALNYGSVAPNPQIVLNEIARRDELIFFVTVISTTNNNINTASHTIQIPIQEMVIINAEGLAAPPLHSDKNLAKPIDSSFEPIFGYLTYPIAMIHGTECSWILNPDYNKKIVITVPNIYVDGVSVDVDGVRVGKYTWVIPYSPLFNSGFPQPTPTAAVFDPNLIASSLTPPSPMVSLLIPNGLPENTFWQIYAGFLWKQVMLGIY